MIIAAHPCTTPAQQQDESQHSPDSVKQTRRIISSHVAAGSLKTRAADSEHYDSLGAETGSCAAAAVWSWAGSCEEYGFHLTSSRSDDDEACDHALHGTDDGWLAEEDDVQ